MHRQLATNQEKIEKEVEWYNLHNTENKIELTKRKRMTKQSSLMTDDLIFRKDGGDSPDQKFEKALTMFKNSIAENPRKAKLIKEQELL